MRAKSPRRERRVLRDEIRDQLIEQILNGKLAPGERIVEMRIAQQFGVSQAPVREALRDLDLLGFVVSSPFRGAIVRQISVEELVQLYPIRAVLEGLAARHAASRMSPATFKKLEGLLATMRTAAARGDHRRAVEADFAFHLTIVEASGNRLLQQIWDRMRLATTTFLTVSKSHHSLREIVERHSSVVDALRTRDPDAAERAMRFHIEEPGEWLRAALEEEAAEVDGKSTVARAAIESAPLEKGSMYDVSTWSVSRGGRRRGGSRCAISHGASKISCPTSSSRVRVSRAGNRSARAPGAPRTAKYRHPERRRRRLAAGEPALSGRRSLRVISMRCRLPDWRIASCRRTADGGVKGVFVSLNEGDLFAYRVTLDR